MLIQIDFYRKKSSIIWHGLVGISYDKGATTFAIKNSSRTRKKQLESNDMFCLFLLHQRGQQGPVGLLVLPRGLELGLGLKTYMCTVCTISSILLLVLVNIILQVLQDCSRVPIQVHPALSSNSYFVSKLTGTVAAPCP